MTRATKVAAVIVVVVTVVGVATLWARARQGLNDKQRLDRAVARAESLGVPIYAEQLRKLKVPDAENAWVEIQAITALLDQKGRGHPVDLSDALELRGDEFLRRANEALPSWEPVFALAKKAAAKTECVADRPWEEGQAMLMSDLAARKQIVKALLVQARFKCLQNNASGSLESLLVAARIAEQLSSEKTVMGVLVRGNVESLIAQEIVVETAIAKGSAERTRLGKVLLRLFGAIDVRTCYAQEPVLYVEWVRTVSDENSFGNSMRKDIKEHGGLSAVADMSGYSVPAKQALKFETLAVEAVCDYAQSLSPEITDFKRNDALYKKLVEAPYGWVKSGYPFGHLQMYDSLGGSSWEGVFEELVRRALRGEIHRAALDVVTNASPRRNGDVWDSLVVPKATLRYSLTSGGFEITASFPDIDQITIGFDRL